MTKVSGESTACGGQCATAGDLTVIVPVWHDAAALEALLTAEVPAGERWVVVNGDPGDATIASLQARFSWVTWIDAARGRGVQQNAGAAAATSAWLLFLHADSQLPPGWRDEIGRAAADGAAWGCFRFRLDSTAWQARLIEWGVAQRVRWLSLPYGDQGLFMRRQVFASVGGFPAYPLMEDVAMVRRLRAHGRPWCSALGLRTSARRWQRDGWCRRSLTNLWLLVRYFSGVAPDRLLARYERPRG